MVVFELSIIMFVNVKEMCDESMAARRSRSEIFVRVFRVFFCVFFCVYVCVNFDFVVLLLIIFI